MPKTPQAEYAPRSENHVEIHSRELVSLYYPLFRPHLEKRSSACSAYLEGDLKALEASQRLAMRMLTGFEEPTCELLIQRLSQPLLKFRRHQADLLIPFKVFPGIQYLPANLFFQIPSRPGLRRQPFTVEHIKCATTASQLGWRLCGTA